MKIDERTQGSLHLKYLERVSAFFSGDYPNTQMKEFIETYSHNFDEDERTQKEEFSAQLTGNRHSPLYNFLGYSSKKPHEAIEQYVNYFSKPNDLLLDPFCGSGGLGVVAAKQRRHCALIDASSLATLISKAYCTYVEINEIQEAFDLLRPILQTAENDLYGSTCHITSKAVNLTAAIWSQTYRCLKCFNVVPLKSAAKGQACPHCSELISTRQERLGYIPWGVRYICPDTRKEIVRSIDGPDDYSINAFREYDEPKLLKQHWNASHIGFVDRPLMNHLDSKRPWGILWRPYHGSIQTVADFFAPRNLYAIQTILNSISLLDCSSDVKDLLRLAVANIVPQCSKQQRHYPGSTFPNMAMPGVLFVPPINEEVNVFRRFFSKRQSLKRGQDAVNRCLKGGKIIISTQDSCNLQEIKGNSVDYVFTDPPYSGRIQYGELNFIQEAVLGLNTEWLNNEIIVNKERGFTNRTWQDRLLSSMKEVFRVLKPGRWVSVCFHDSDPSSWERLQDVMLEAGFLPGGSSMASSMETGWHTLKMHTSEDITKRDLVVNYRKPLGYERSQGICISDHDNPTIVGQKVLNIIKEVLETTPGQTKDRIYDEVVSRLVRSGEMQAHSYDELLKQIAEPVGDDPKRWFLKESEYSLIDEAESARENRAAQIVNDFITAGITKNPEIDGVHYSDIFEHYIYAVKDKPRRLLQDWLLDYYYKTLEGTYRLPLSDEESLSKAEGRSKGTNRRIKRYIAFLEQGLAIPEKERPNDATIAEWVRHCKRSGLYEQGKLLYERGGLNFDTLPEEAQVNVEEDYQTCVRMLNRATDTKKGKKQMSPKDSLF